MLKININMSDYYYTLIRVIFQLILNQRITFPFVFPSFILIFSSCGLSLKLN